MAVDGTSMGEGWLGALADWLSARTTLVLVLLMVQLALLVALWPLFSGPTIKPKVDIDALRQVLGPLAEQVRTNPLCTAEKPT
ncbi:MAG: hypothetical protein KA145_08835 [Alicycliphilus sp.]|nr:hypothetical protein [Alicycliphilus sp.]